jgi:hypothetical protein
MNRRLCGPQRWTRPFGRNIKLFPLLRIKTLFSRIPVHYTELLRLPVYVGTLSVTHDYTVLGDRMIMNSK